MKPKPIYLDYAAATPVRQEVLAAMQPFGDERFHNPSAIYAAGREAHGALDQARHRVAQVLGAKKTEIVFTAGGTESLNLALLGVAKANPGCHIVTTAIEHEAVLDTLHSLEASGHKLTVVPVKPNGIVDPAEVSKAIVSDTVLVSVMYANNEIGTIQPIGEIAKAIKVVRAKRDQPIYLHTDASQAGAYLDLHVDRLGVDLMTLNGGKVYGPKQSGCLYVRTGTKIASLLHGGGQEHGLRSGTENVAGAIGFVAALELAQAERAEESKRQSELRDGLLRDIQAAIPHIIVNGDTRYRLPNNINLTVSGIDGEMAVLHLDREGFQIGTGSACAASSDEPSHVLLAIGRSVAEANASLRLTLGRDTTRRDIDALFEALAQVVAELRLGG